MSRHPAGSASSVRAVVAIVIRTAIGLFRKTLALLDEHHHGFFLQAFGFGSLLFLASTLFFFFSFLCCFRSLFLLSFPVFDNLLPSFFFEGLLSCPCSFTLQSALMVSLQFLLLAN